MTEAAKQHKDVVTVVAARGVFIVTIALFLIALLYVGYRSDTRDAQIERSEKIILANQKQIAINTAALKGLVYEGCLESQRAAEGINTVLEALIESVQTAPIYSPSERATRIKRYTDAKMKIPICNK